MVVEVVAKVEDEVDAIDIEIPIHNIDRNLHPILISSPLYFIGCA